MIDKEEEKIVLGKHIGVIYLLYLTYIQTKQIRFWVRKKTSKLSGWLLVALDILVFLYVVVVVCVLFVCWIISIYLSHQICSWAEQSLWDKVMTFICIIMHYIRFDIVRSWVACRSVHMHIMYIYFACSIFTIMYDYMHMPEVANMSKGFSLWFHYYDYDVQKLYVGRSRWWRLSIGFQDISRGHNTPNMYVHINNGA